MEQGRYQPRRRRRRAHIGKLIWLAGQACGEPADALHRDLLRDGLAFDDLGWRGLWAYVTAAPPGTALHYAQSEGWTLSDKIAAESLHVLREIAWRYTAVHFTDGATIPFPQRIPYPGSASTDTEEIQHGWETATLDELVSPEVRALLRGE